MKITDPRIIKNIEGNYFIKNNLDHKELDIIAEALSIMIHKGIPDPQRYEEVVKLYGEIQEMWDNTTLTNPLPVNPQLVKENVIEPQKCPDNSTWNDKLKDCVPNNGYYKDSDTGEIKPVPISDCGLNAHFDSEKGCVCNDGFERDKLGNCVPIPTK